MAKSASVKAVRTGEYNKQGLRVRVEKDVLNVLDEVLLLKGRGAGFVRATPLLGALPELDSMAILSLITTLEERFGFVIHDDEMEGAVFATLGSLTDYVTAKLDSAVT